MQGTIQEQLFTPEGVGAKTLEIGEALLTSRRVLDTDVRMRSLPYFLRQLPGHFFPTSSTRQQIV